MLFDTKILLDRKKIYKNILYTYLYYILMYFIWSICILLEIDLSELFLLSFIKHDNT